MSQRAKDAQPTNDLISIGEASLLLGVSVYTLRRWDAKGRLVPVRMPSGQRRYRRTEIEALARHGAAA